MFVYQGDRDAGAYEDLTVDNTTGGVGFAAASKMPTSGFYKGMTAVGAFCTLETAQIRFTLDGTAPTTTLGHILNAGQTLTLESSEDVRKFRAIRTGGTSGVMRCTFRF